MRDLITRHSSKPHIPTRKNRKVRYSVGPALPQQRNLVERFFNKLKHYRGIVTRYDKLTRNFLDSIRDEHADSRLDIRKPAVGCRRLVSDATKVITDAPERVVRILVGIPDHADDPNTSGFGLDLKQFF